MNGLTDQNSNSVCLYIAGLDSRRITWWLDRADDLQETDPITGFFSAWVSFNYYYCTFAFSPQHKSEFITKWAKGKWPGGKDKGTGDRSQWSFLVNDDRFKKVYSGCKVTQPSLFELTVKLPIKNMQNGREIPSNKKGEYKVGDLSIDQVFAVLYQIRNNLFHGQKDPHKDERDRDLTVWGVKFLAPFMRELLKHTNY